MTRVLIVDDQEMIRVGLRAILAEQAQFEVVGDLRDGLGVVEFLAYHPADVVLMDIRMPGIDGIEATRRIRSRYSSVELRIIVLTTFDQDDNVLAALRAGANGFLSKGVGPIELAAGIGEVARGGGALSAAAAAALIGHVAQDAPRQIDSNMTERFATLTPRELAIVRAACGGLTNAEIAEQMFISPFTVKTHANRAMTKVGASDRAQLVAFAFKGGIVS